ncbi:MAG: hypothetical protein R2864_07000 [Syntrophotaleaceae bacterium]
MFLLNSEYALDGACPSALSFEDKLSGKGKTMSEQRVIAFDLFGTLVEMPVQHHPYRKAIAVLELDPEATRKKAMTRSQAFADLFHNLPAKERVCLEKLLKEELSRIRPYPEVPGVLERLVSAGYRLCVISNLAAPYVAAMDRLPRYLFEAEVMSCEIGAVKPELLSTRRRLGEWGYLSSLC